MAEAEAKEFNVSVPSDGLQGAARETGSVGRGIQDRRHHLFGVDDAGQAHTHFQAPWRPSSPSRKRLVLCGSASPRTSICPTSCMASFGHAWRRTALPRGTPCWRLDLGVRTTAILDKKAALWEYYKACAAKKPVYGQRASMSYGPDSYIGQLHASLAEFLDPRVVESAKYMHSPKALRDFVVSWCFFWQCCRPPFQNGGDRGQWIYDQWEELPMHEIESANDDDNDMSDSEVLVNDAADVGDELSVPGSNGLSVFCGTLFVYFVYFWILGESYGTPAAVLAPF